MLEKREEEMNKLEKSLASKNDGIEKLKEETKVYKRQYENLLEEYNQYLEDLEALQVKLGS
jgi:uncharacterized protein YoxC